MKPIFVNQDQAELILNRFRDCSWGDLTFVFRHFCISEMEVTLAAARIAILTLDFVAIVLNLPLKKSHFNSLVFIFFYKKVKLSLAGCPASPARLKDGSHPFYKAEEPVMSKCWQEFPSVVDLNKRFNKSTIPSFSWSPILSSFASQAKLSAGWITLGLNGLPTPLKIKRKCTSYI